MESLITILAIWFTASVPFTFFIGAIFKLGKKQPVQQTSSSMNDNSLVLVEVRS